jgi:hypothetical protein
MTKEKFNEIINKKYNKLTKELKSIIGTTKKYNISVHTNKNEENILELNINNKKITTKYEILGVYDTTTNIFCWANNYRLIDKNKIQLLKKIKEYHKIIENFIINTTYSDIEYLDKLYYYLSNTIFMLDQKNIDDIVILGTFITNSKGIIFNENEKQKIFYIITDIITK